MCSHFNEGCVSSICCHCVLGVILQVETVKGDRKFQGMGATLRLIWREEGIRGYFKGNGTNVMRIVPYVAVQFAAYEEYKKVYE